MRVHSWRSKQTGLWVEGTPYSYSAANRIRARYVDVRGNEKFVEIKRWPDKPGLTATQQTEFIESRLPGYFDSYLSGGLVSVS